MDRSAVYVPARQAPISGMIFLAVRARGEPARLAGPVCDALAGVDPLLRAQQVRTIREAIDENSRSLTWIAWQMGVCGALGALLALVGIDSLMTCTVSQREHEFGVRMALGATSGDVLRMTLAQAGRLAAAGVAAGLGLAWLFGRAQAGLVTDVLVVEPSIFVVVPPALALVALAAAYVPARRALRVQPSVVLRQ